MIRLVRGDIPSIRAIIISMNDFSQSLKLSQSQNLVMTPQLQQAIKLLQLNNMELNEFIEEELEKNPLLERDESPVDAEGSDGVSEDGPENDVSAGDEVDISAGGDDFDAGSQMAEIGSGGSSKFEEMDERFENRLESTKTLRDHLMEQVQLSIDDPRDRMIAALLIDRLDESGYLREGEQELADKLGCSVERVEVLLARLKSFDPAGVFARDLTDCLAIQLDDKGTLDEPMRKLLENLDLVGKHEFEKLTKICGVNQTYLKDMLEEIRALNPKPAADFDHLVVQTAVPDVLMKRLPKHVGGGWKVELNTSTLPRVLVNQEYYTTVMQGASQKKDREYMTTQLQSANWLVRAMEQRAHTILKVASEIVEQQNAFFLYGIEFLRPMTLRDIAEEIDMHESTVSRVTSGKFIGTPRGLFELKYFFSTGLVSSGGVSHSAESIKARIKSLIDDEDPKKILSDDKLVEMLKAEGIDVARRTVAKYREAMNIGSSVQRRREKKNLSL